MSVTWTADMECALFYSMIDHKPVGENKHFHMIFIYEKFNNLNEKKLSTNQLWEHLDQLYDMNALNENEAKPFPNDEIDFSLPESIRDSSAQNSPGSETPKSVFKSLRDNKSSESFFKEAKANLTLSDTQMELERENSTTNSPKNESGSNLNSSSSQTKPSLNDLSTNDNSSNEDASETSSKATTRSVTAKNEAATSKKKKTNTKQTSRSDSRSKKRK